jgi:hypothetical protein
LALDPDFAGATKAPASRALALRVAGAKISVCHGVGGMFAASGTIMSNEPP